MLKRGVVPGDMDDRWFAFFEHDWLYFHRSWTGHCIFGVRLEGAANARVVEAWVSRDADQYGSDSIEEDERTLNRLLSSLVAGQLGPSNGPQFESVRAE